jgi:hypothetical protein
MCDIAAVLTPGVMSSVLRGTSPRVVPVVASALVNAAVVPALPKVPPVVPALPGPPPVVAITETPPVVDATAAVVPANLEVRSGKADEFRLRSHTAPRPNPPPSES